MSAKDAKNNFGLLLDRARAAPVEILKHGRPVVVALSVEEFEGLYEEYVTCSSQSGRTLKVNDK